MLDSSNIRLRHGAMLGLTLLLAVPWPAAAQLEEPSPVAPAADALMPHCGPPMDGQVICKFGTFYECELIPPNSLERRTGWRWKADPLRSCPEPTPRAAAPQYALPPGFTYAPQSRGSASSTTTQGAEHGVNSRPPGATLYIRPTEPLAPYRSDDE